MTGPITLTHEELAELTDCRRTVGQIAWLRERRWVFELGRTGKPKVSRKYALSKLGVRGTAPKGKTWERARNPGPWAKRGASPPP
jgi:hypothetical protein